MGSTELALHASGRTARPFARYRGRVAFADVLDRHRVELTGYCFRMLGSGSEAEDAVQETMLRAWSNAERFDENLASLRTWLYRIASNVCLDMTRSAQRRALATDLGPESVLGAALGTPLSSALFVQPVPDQRVLPALDDPAEVAVQRETIRLAFVAALQVLPPRQRAVLILRDVLAWPAADVARVLDSTPAAVNSALQRARASMPAAGQQRASTSAKVTDALVERYVEAFTAYDVDALVELMHADVTMSMPPYAWWIRGRERVRTVLLAAGGACAGDRLVRTRAAGSPAVAQYRDGRALGLVVLDFRDELVASTTTYLDPWLMPAFGLPMNLTTSDRM